MRLKAYGPSGSARWTDVMAWAMRGGASPAAPNVASNPARPSAVTNVSEAMPLAMAPAAYASATP